MKKAILIVLALLVALLGISILGAYLITKPMDGFEFGDKVAVIEIHGSIAMAETSGLFGETRATPEKIKRMIKKAEGDGSVKAIVFDINSPGGSVVASEEIARAIKGAEKPTVAWLSEIATSGGYYVASACDYVVADKATITGSIGVISIFPEYSGLLEKLGINITIIKAGEFKDFSSGLRPMKEEEKEMIFDTINEIYDDFINVIAENRDMDKGTVKEIAGGRIYTGSQAVELKLADEVGGREDAIDLAGELGGIKGKPKVVVYKRTAFFEEFVGIAFSRFGYGFAKGIKEDLKSNFNPQA